MKSTTYEPDDPAGAAIFVDGAGTAPESFWKISRRFMAERPRWFVGCSSHERDDWWKWLEVFYAARLPIFVNAHSFAGTVVAAASELTPFNVCIGFDPVWPARVANDREFWDTRPARVRLIDDINLATQAQRHQWEPFRHCACYLRKQGSNNRFMPGVRYECREVLPAVIRCQRGHNGVIEENRRDVERLLLSAAGPA